MTDCKDSAVAPLPNSNTGMKRKAGEEANQQAKQPRQAARDQKDAKPAKQLDNPAACMNMILTDFMLGRIDDVSTLAACMMFSETVSDDDSESTKDFFEHVLKSAQRHVRMRFCVGKDMPKWHAWPYVLMKMLKDGRLLAPAVDNNDEQEDDPTCRVFWGTSFMFGGQRPLAPGDV